MNSEKRTTFQMRLYTLYKNKHIGRVRLSEEMGISIHTLNGYFKRGARLPDHSVMCAFAKFFNVDVGYLYGEQDIPRLQVATISSITGLSQEAADKIYEICKDDDLRYAFKELLLSNQINDLLSKVYDAFLMPYYENINKYAIISKYDADSVFGTIIDEIKEKHYNHEKRKEEAGIIEKIIDGILQSHISSFHTEDMKTGQIIGIEIAFDEAKKRYPDSAVFKLDFDSLFECFNDKQDDINWKKTKISARNHSYDPVEVYENYILGCVNKKKKTQKQQGKKQAAEQNNYRNT